jgi:hypothetical protein
MSDLQSQADLQTQPQAEEREIIARPGTRYRVTHYIVVIIMLGAGLWFFRDGFYAWPKQNAAVPPGLPLPHPNWDIPLNRLLGIVLPVGSIILLIRTLYNSRGVYRLVGETLHIPGQPPIPLDAICRIDKRKWDKKGIAYIDYEVPGTSETRRFRFDDYVYDREPADKIFKRIEKHAEAMA